MHGWEYLGIGNWTKVYTLWNKLTLHFRTIFRCCAFSIFQIPSPIGNLYIYSTVCLLLLCLHPVLCYETPGMIPFRIYTQEINIDINVNRYLPHCIYILLGSKPLGIGTVGGYSLLTMSHSWRVWNSSACTTLCTRCSSPFQQMWESVFCLKSCSSLKCICSSVSDMHLCHCRNWNKTKGSLKKYMM